MLRSQNSFFFAITFIETVPLIKAEEEDFLSNKQQQQQKKTKQKNDIF